MSYMSQDSQHQGQQQRQEEAPPPPYTYTPATYTPAGAGAGEATQFRQLQFPPTMPGGPGSANPVPHGGDVAPPALPPRTPRTPRAPQFRGTVGAPQAYGEGVVDMSGTEYDAAPDSYFARPTGPRAPQLDTREEDEPGQGTQQAQQSVATSGGMAAGILERDDIQSYYQPPVFPNKQGEKPLQDVKQPIQEQYQQQQPDPYYQSQQHSAPVVYRPPAAPLFSPQVDQHQQLHSISSVVNPVSSPAMGYAETPTMFHPPPTSSYPPPAAAPSPALSHYPPSSTAPSPALSHYPPPSTAPMFSPAAVVRPLPTAPLHHSGSVSMPVPMPVPMPMPEPSKLPMSPPAPEHTTIMPTPIIPQATIPGGPGLVTNFKCKECGGLLDSEFAVCTRLHTPLTAYAAPQIGYSTRPDSHLDGQHSVPPVPQHHQPQHGYYPQPQQPQQQHGYYPQPQQHHHHSHNPYPQQQPVYGGYAHHYPQPTVVTAVAAHPSNNHGTDDAYYRRPLTNGFKKLFGVATQSYGANHQIVSPMPVAPAIQPVHHIMPSPQGQAGTFIPLAGPPPTQAQHHHQPYYQQQQQYPSVPYPSDHHHGMMSPVAGFQQPPYAMPGVVKDGYGYGGAGAGLMRSVNSTQPPST